MRFVAKLCQWVFLIAGCAFGQPKLPRPSSQLNVLDACRGQVTVTAFIVTTCPHCKAFTRSVMEPMYKAGQFCAVAVAFDEDADTARFAREQGLTFPVYKMERRFVREFLGMTGADRVIGTPQIVVIDKKGVIRAQSAPQGSPLLLQRDVIREIVGQLQ